MTTPDMLKPALRRVLFEVAPWAGLGFLAIEYGDRDDLTNRYGYWPFGVALGFAVWVLCAVLLGAAAGKAARMSVVAACLWMVLPNMVHCAVYGIATDGILWPLGLKIRAFWFIVALVAGLLTRRLVIRFGLALGR